VDGDANIIFGAAFDPALDGKIRVSVVATGMDEAVIQQIEPQGQAFSRTGGLSVAAPRQPEVRIEPVREAARQPAPAYEAPAARAPEPKIEAKPEPVIHDAPRNLEPIVDPWVEEYEQGAGRAQPAAASEQGDLYFDRAPQRQQPAPQPAQRPAARHEQPVEEPFYDERDHRRSGWSLFGRKRQQPQQQPAYAPPPSSNRTTQQLRQTQSVQPQTQDPQLGQSDDDDLEIPSFLRRLAN
jgi:cell division protein FtsZ